VPIVAKDRRAGLDALGHLAELLDDLRARTGLTEEELAQGVIRGRRSR
jgi:hypothetical protein